MRAGDSFSNDSIEQSLNSTEASSRIGGNTEGKEAIDPQARGSKGQGFESQRLKQASAGKGKEKGRGGEARGGT